MEELSRDFVETFKGELVRGAEMQKKDVRGDIIDPIVYEVTKEDADSKGIVVVTITLRVGKVIVFKREFGTNFGNKKEIEAAQVQSVRTMINELPYLYKAAKSYVDKIKNRSPGERALEGLTLLKSAWNQI